LQIMTLPHYRELALPAYQTASAAGMDLLAAIDTKITISPGERVAIATGLAMAIPDGYEGQVRPRSGLARHHGLTVANAPGTIDADYRGEVMVLLIHLGTEAVVIERGMRIAQLVIAPVTQAVIEAVETLDDTSRGIGGFGSTGTGTGEREQARINHDTE
jgi:dUTP pyrophosphatase